MVAAQPHVQFKKKKYARSRQHVVRPVAMGMAASAEQDVRGEASMKPAAGAGLAPEPMQAGKVRGPVQSTHAQPPLAQPAAQAPDSLSVSGSALPAGSGAYRTRYSFPKTPWHSPLPDPVVRPSAVPPVFVPIADEDEVERRIMLHHRKRRSWGAKLARALLYTFSIVLVLVAGLITTVWVEENGGLEATVAMLVSKSTGADDAAGDNPRAQPSRHELPYDGQTPGEPAPLAARAERTATGGTGPAAGHGRAAP